MTQRKRKVTILHIVVICGKAAMLAQSDGVSSQQSRAIRNRNGSAPRSSCGAQPRVRPNSPSKADLDGKSKGVRSAQERPPIQNAFGWGGWALVGMDGLCGEPSRRQHRWPVARHGADRRQVASVLLSLEGAVALALLARRGRAGSIRLCPRLGADMHATRPLRNQ